MTHLWLAIAACLPCRLGSVPRPRYSARRRKWLPWRWVLPLLLLPVLLLPVLLLPLLLLLQGTDGRASCCCWPKINTAAGNHRVALSAPHGAPAPARTRLIPALCYRRPPLPPPAPAACLPARPQVRLKEFEGALREYKKENGKFFEMKERYKASIAGLEKEVQVRGGRPRVMCCCCCCHCWPRLLGYGYGEGCVGGGAE